MVVSLDRGDTLFAASPDAALAPASNVKLLTTAAALHVLGPEYRFRTYLLTDGTVSNGVIDGDLVLYGTGDPGISDRFYSGRDEVFHLLIDQLEEAGIHTIRGDLVADASYLPGPLRPEGWDPGDLNDHFTAAISALSFNENVVSFRIVPREALGTPPDVFTIPDHSGLEVVNTAETVSGRVRPPGVWIERRDPLDPVLVDGRITRGSRDVWRQLTVPRPSHFTASVFAATLEGRGVVVHGELRTVELPANSVVSRFSAPSAGRRGARVLARHVSGPLRDYLEVINKESNNLFAELVFRAMGRAGGGVGTPDVSSRVVRTTLEGMGVNTERMLQLDGSGLSEGNRVSAGTFVGVLSGMAQGPLWSEYWASLPEAGQRRELGRMYQTAAAGNLRAKTGTIEGVSALSGMVRSADGERLAFSLLLNGTPSNSRAKAVENRVGARLASFERGPGRAPPIRMAEAEPLPERPIGASPARHRVASGENLTLIARRYGVTIEALLSVNPRLRPNRIVAGQWITLPLTSSGS
jgi:D-alanyl-D-alanine carboxypeptidase/D-alanyl-D-alanine-endopeptidase (penicillin-binding protein 4)